MSKKKDLVKNTFIILLGKVCTQFLSFFLMPLYTNVLSSSEYGTVDLIITYVALFVPVITLQIEMGLFRNLIDFREDEKARVRVVTSGLRRLCLQLIAFVVIFTVLNLFVKIPHGIYILLCIIFTMTSNVLLQIARGNGDNVGYSCASVIAGVSTVLLNVLFLIFLKFKIEGMLLSSALANLIATIYLFFRCKLYKLIDIKARDKKTERELLKYSLPLVPNGLIWWIINVSDRTIITVFLGMAVNGIYAVSNKFSNILIQVFNVFNLSWTESASIHIKDDDRDAFFSDIFDVIIKLFSSVCILLILSMPLIFDILVGTEFREAYQYIPLLLIGMLFNIVVSFIGSIYVSLKLTKQVAETSFYSGLLNILINVLFVKLIGIYAAIISTIIAFLSMSIYRYIDVKKYINLKINVRNVATIIVLFIISAGIYYIGYNVLTICVSLILIFTIAYLNRNVFAFLSKKR